MAGVGEAGYRVQAGADHGGRLVGTGKVRVPRGIDNLVEPQWPMPGTRKKREPVAQPRKAVGSSSDPLVQVGRAVGGDEAVGIAVVTMESL